MIEAAFFAVALLAAGYLLAPVFTRSDVQAQDPRIPLHAAHNTALRALKDLDLDWATGKLSEEDYRAQRATVTAEAADVVRRLRTLGWAPPDPERDEPADEEDGESSEAGEKRA